MATGIETAGVIMASIPLIISALENYAEGVRTVKRWWRYRRELQSLATTLIVEKTLFSGVCQKLLDGLTIDDEVFIDLIENPGGSLWKDEQLDRDLRQHLGKSYALYQSLIEEMGFALKELMEKLEIDENGKVRSIKWKVSCLLLTILTAEQPPFTNYHESKSQWKRVKFSVCHRAYTEALTKIRDNNALLARLTNQNTEILSTQRHKRRSGAHLKVIRDQAANLYGALARGWACDCGVAHCTTLRLDPRLSGFRAHSHEKFSNVDKGTFVSFKVAFLFEADTAPQRNFPWLRQELEVRVFDQKRTIKQRGGLLPLINPNVVDGPSLPPSVSGNSAPREILKRKRVAKFVEPTGKKVVRFVEPEAKPVLASSSSVSEDELPTQIDNLCFTMRNTSVGLTCAEKCLGYLDYENDYRFKLYLSDQNRTEQDESSKSLALLLSERNRDNGLSIVADEHLSLTRGERLGLSLIVASSVLQLHDTPWLRSQWSKEDIFVNMTRKRGIFERAFISKIFPPAESNFKSEYHSHLLRNVTLFALGILLIEICLGRTLESLRTNEDPVTENGDSDILTRMSIARRVLQLGRISDEAGTKYEEVVYRCIWCEFGVCDTNLNNDSFRRAVYDQVVAPLETDLNYFNES